MDPTDIYAEVVRRHLAERPEPVRPEEPDYPRASEDFGRETTDYTSGAGMNRISGGHGVRVPEAPTSY